MPAAPSAQYLKLPGRGRRGAALFSYARSRLWLGEDHLLSVDFTVASEEYRRFYFRDIEVLIIRRTATRQIWNWIFALLTLLSAGPFAAAWRSAGDGGFMVAAIGCAAFWGVLALINSSRGAGCRTHIRTAVQTEHLPSLSRLPVARRVLARLQPLIVAAQGASTPDELAGMPWAAADSPARGRPASAAAPVRADRGTWHGALFGLLILEGVLTAISFLFFQEPISVFSLLAFLGGAIVCMVALMRQGGTDLPAAVRLTTQVALGYFVLKCLVGFIYMIVYSIRHPGKPMTTGLEMAGEPGFAETAMASAGLGALIGLLGMIFLVVHRQRPAASRAT